MRFDHAIDAFFADMRSAGRINSQRTEVNYRIALEAHQADIANRDPAYTGREDVKVTLARWQHPNTQRKNRSILVSFYDWCVEEGLRPYNPARQTRRPKKRPTSVYRLTRAEAAGMLAACETVRERRAIHLGICAGLRLAELQNLQGRHFQRAGFVWVSPDIGKGGKERWVPVIADLAPTWIEIAQSVAPDEYVLPAERWRNPPHNTERSSLLLRPCSRQVIRTIVGDVAARAGIAAHIHPHLMRHAFGDHIARYAGLKQAQAMLGHADIDTTAGTYTGKPTLDELAVAITGFSFTAPPADRTSVLGVGELGENAREAPTRIELVDNASRLLAGFLVAAAPRIDLYAAHFKEVM